MRRAAVAAFAWLFQSGLSSALSVGSVMPMLALAAGRPLLSLSLLSYLLFLWTMYLLDRALPAPEDIHQASDGAAAHLRRHRRSYQQLCGSLLLAQLVCCVAEPRLLLALGASLVLSLGYLLPVPGLGCRIKQIPCAKPLYLSAVILCMPWLFLGKWPLLGVELVASLCLFLVFLVNLSLYDLKDLEGDAEAGIVSWAAALSLPGLLRLNAALLTLTAALALLLLPAQVALWVLSVCAVYALGLLLLRRLQFGALWASGLDGAHAGVVLAGLLLGA